MSEVLQLAECGGVCVWGEGAPGSIGAVEPLVLEMETAGS